MASPNRLTSSKAATAASRIAAYSAARARRSEIPCATANRTPSCGAARRGSRGGADRRSSHSRCRVPASASAARSCSIAAWASDFDASGPECTVPVTGPSATWYGSPLGGSPSNPSTRRIPRHRACLARSSSSESISASGSRQRSTEQIARQHGGLRRSSRAPSSACAPPNPKRSAR